MYNELDNPKDMKFTAMTWNLANENPPAETMDQLKGQITDDPDIIIFSLQEAKETLLKWENAGERIIKRLNENKGNIDEQYTIIHNDSFRVVTKPSIYNITNMARTGLVIAVKNKYKEQISILESGYERSSESINKGGLYAKLQIGNKKIGVISVHLDSNSPEERQAEIKALMDHFDDELFDDIIFLGDLNERLETGFQDLLDNSSTRLDDIEKKEQQVIAKHDPISKHGTYLSMTYGFQFHQLDRFTYVETNADGTVRAKPKRAGQLDIGTLDNIGTEEKALKKDKPTVFTPTDSTGKPISDHKAVFCNITLPAVDFTKKKEQTVVSNLFYQKISDNTIEMQVLGNNSSTSIDRQ
ncbi:endonuclease/exonuclease/phosphatase family protein [Thiotrichales bacterium 19X7-9]|nr:endonuclease/exonuclease/phosphatase family protein [Thiotrichales bacterium 19X7-9]